MPEIHAVLFDLDGTLVDTAPDLANALNTLLIEEGRQPMSLAGIRPEASHGARAMIQHGFGIDDNDPEFDRLKQRFLEFYAAKLCQHSRLMDGMAEVVDRLEANGRSWGIVTNKPGYLTTPLLAALGLDHRAACIVSGDSTAHRKPHPGPLRFACSRLGNDADQCLYIGDAERDIQAGRGAGLQTLVALYGYIRKNETPEHWGADGMVNRPAEILEWLELN